MGLIWSRSAKRDLIELLAYVASTNPRAAERVAVRIDEAAKVLTDFPFMGRIGRCPGSRELVIAGLPWLLVYEVAAHDIHLLRVLHGARQWPDRLEEPGP